jgi:hypothetical protein
MSLLEVSQTPRGVNAIGKLPREAIAWNPWGVWLNRVLNISVWIPLVARSGFVALVRYWLNLMSLEFTIRNLPGMAPII